MQIGWDVLYSSSIGYKIHVTGRYQLYNVFTWDLWVLVLILTETLALGAKKALNIRKPRETLQVLWYVVRIPRNPVVSHLYVPFLML